MIFLKWLISLVWGGGGTVATIAKALQQAHSDSVNAHTADAKIESDERIAVLTQQMAVAKEAEQHAADIRLATSGYREMRVITAWIAGCFALHLTAVTADTVFGFSWDVAKFPAPFDNYEGVILLSFFGLTAVTSILGRK